MQRPAVVKPWRSQCRRTVKPASPRKRPRTAWRDLLDLRLIERFSADYAARLSLEGVAFIESGQLAEALLVAPLPGRSRKVLIVRGSDTGARERVAGFVEDLDFRAIAVHEDADLMTQLEAQGEVSFAIVLLTPNDLGGVNVLLQLGYLIGRLGRSRVFAFAMSSSMALPPIWAVLLCGPLMHRRDGSMALRRDLDAVE